MSVFMQPIYTQTVGASGVASITFNNIPQGYTDLVIEMSLRSANTSTMSGMYIQVNGSGSPSGTHSITRMIGSGSTVSTSRDFGYTGDFLYAGSFVPDASATANTFSNARVTIRNYTSGNFKPIEIEGMGELNAATGNFIYTSGAQYLNTKPITSLFFAAGNYTFAQYSTITIYGLSANYQTQLPTAPTIGTVTDQAGFASVAFTPIAVGSSTDQATTYAVTTNPSSSTTYVGASPAIVPTTIGTSTTYQVSAVNSLGSTASTASSQLTTYNNYASIATLSTTATLADQFRFVNIPQGYQHLQIRLFSRSINTGGAYATCYVGFNGEIFSGSNYANHYVYGDGASTSYGNAVSAGQGNIPNIPWNAVTANYFAVTIIDILDYSNYFKAKTVKTISGWDANGTGRAQFASFSWNNLSPISAISLTPDGGWGAYSHAALYGIG